MANQYVDLKEPPSEEDVPKRRFGKKTAFIGILIGMGCGCVWALSQDGQQVADPTNAMAMNVNNGQALQSQKFLRFRQPVQSRNFLRSIVWAQPPEAQDKLVLDLKTTQGALDSMYASFKKNFLNVEPDTGVTQGWATVVAGKVPVELTGTLMRNGPALFERNGFQKPFLDGDGMVSSIAFKDGKAYFRNRFVRTPGFVKEQKHGAFSELSIFTDDDPRPAISGKPMWYHRLVEDMLLGPPSPKNTGAFNIWYWGGSLVAVDFSKPFPLDKDTLDTVEPYSKFSSEDFTAHSREVFEPDGSKRLCCFLPYVDWAKRTTIVTFKEFDEAGHKVAESEHKFQAAYFHDMIVTDQWYILFDCPIDMDYYKAFIGYPMGENSLGNTAKEDRSRRPMFRLFPRPGRNNRPPVVAPVEEPFWGFAFHHVNGFDVDETGTKVVFDTVTWDKFTLYFEDIVLPDGKKSFPRTRLTRFSIDTDSSTAVATTLDDTPCEAPTVAPDSTGTPYKYAYMTASSCRAGEQWHDGCNTSPMHELAKVSISGIGADAHVVRESWVPWRTAFAGEPVFVQRPGSTAEDDGWVLMLLHETEGPEGPHTEVAILDAQHVADGPIARLRLPTYVPMGVHGSFTKHYILGPTATPKTETHLKDHAQV